MVYRIVLVLCLSLCYLRAAEIPAGSNLLLQMLNSINTRTAQEGDYVYLRTATPVVINNKIVVPAGSYVQGVVTHAKQSGRMKGRAELGIRLETLTLSSGTVYHIAPRLASVASEDT